MSASRCVKLSACSSKPRASVRRLVGYTQARHGLTLLELVVVLGILAVISSVAVRSLEPIADQTRFNCTQNVLDQLEFATRGPSQFAIASTPQSITGYIADNGALPANLTSFLTKPASLASSAVYNFDADRDGVNDVTLTSGWQGPYFHLGAGQTSILDGWGNAPVMSTSAGSLTFLSRGSDNDSTGDESGFRADLSTTIDAAEYQGSIVFQLWAVDSKSNLTTPSPTASQKLGVLFYGVNANGGTTGAIQEQLLLVPKAGNYDYLRSNTTLGLIAAKGIHWTDSNNDNKWTTGETLVKDTSVFYSYIIPKVELHVDMILR